MNAAVHDYAPAQSSSGLRLEVAVLAILWLTLSVASGYRWFGPGRDYIYYSEFYANLAAGNYFYDERFEPLFVATAWVFKYLLFSEFQLFIAVLVAVALGIKLQLIYRLTRWPFVACITYLMMFYALHEYTQIRQSLAIAFGLLSIHCYLERRFVWSLAWIAVGALFQSSIVVLGIGVLLFNLLALGRVAVGLGVLAVAALAGSVTSISSVLFLSAIVPNFSVYVLDALQYEPLNLASGPNLLFVAMLAVAAPLIGPSDRQRMMYLIMCLLAVVSFVVLIDFPVLAQRFRDMYAVFGILLAFSFPRRSFGTLSGALMLLAGCWSLSKVGDILTVG